MIELIFYSLAVASISMTLTRSNIFSKFRKIIKNIFFLGKLFKCPYCMAHWISFLFVLFLNNLRFNNLIELFISVFVLVTLSVPWMLIIEIFYNQLEKYEIIKINK